MTTTMRFKVGQIWVFWVDDIRIEELITSVEDKNIHTKIISSPFGFIQGNTQSYTYKYFRQNIKEFNGGLKLTFETYYKEINEENSSILQSES